MELGGLLATTGAAVCCFDLDFATQGLGRHVEGRVGVEASTLLAEPDADFEEAIRDWPVDGEGSLGVIPSLAPFRTIAEAKSEAAGARVEDRLEEATERADWVLLDVPPVVSNQAIGAVTAADQVVAV
jgi:CobQ/CobB/MinD/ParA nucleotide binding domain.